MAEGARRARLALEALGLVAVVAFVAAVAYLPHADSARDPPPEGPSFARLGQVYWDLARGERQDYPYTVHVDENVHWVAFQSIEREGTLRHHGLFFGTGGGDTALSLRGLVHERGFHVTMVAFQALTGIPWLELFRFLPAAWLAATAAMLWLALRPWRGALAAAALVALVPTTARFLGPGFLVPIGFAPTLMVGVLLLLPHASRRALPAALLFLVVTWAFFLHLLAGFAALIVLLCALPFARGNRKGMALLAGVALLPLLALLEVFLGDAQQEFDRIGGLFVDATVFDQVGVWVLALWAAGCALVALRPPPGPARLPILAATLASAVMFSFLAYTLFTKVHVYALYDRWHQPFALLASVPAGYAIVEGGALLLDGARALARRARRAWVPRPRPQAAALALGLLCLGGFAAAVQDPLGYHLHEPYYHVVQDEDWESFRWVAANAGPEYEVFLAEPWRAVVLSAMTGMRPHTFLAPGEPPIRGEDYQAYLGGTHGDPVWLVGRDVSLVVSPVPAGGDEFRLTGPRTSQLDPALAAQLAEVRAREGARR